MDHPHRTRRLGVLVVACSLLLTLPLASQPPQRSAAVVFALSGTATVKENASTPGRAVALFDWVDRGTLEVGPASFVRIALPSGQRYELGSGSSARLEDGNLQPLAGTVTRLSPVSPLPRVYALFGDRATAGAAVRIRADLDGLYPERGARSDADATVLHFDRPATVTGSATRYEIEIASEELGVVFRTRVTSGPVTVPPGVLKPGSRYLWSVQGPGKAGLSTRVEAELVTLSDEQARERRALRASLPKEPELWDLALAAAIDQRLGLLRESREELRRLGLHEGM